MPLKGWHHSAESRAKISAAQMGKTHCQVKMTDAERRSPRWCKKCQVITARFDSGDCKLCHHAAQVVYRAVPANRERERVNRATPARRAQEYARQTAYRALPILNADGTVLMRDGHPVTNQYAISMNQNWHRFMHGRNDY
jgi:NUMOD3 motif